MSKLKKNPKRNALLRSALQTIILDCIKKLYTKLDKLQLDKV